MKKQGLFLIASGLIVLVAVTILLSKKPERKRPQESEIPYTYYSQNITFYNSKDNISLAGTLTLPKTKANFRLLFWLTALPPKTEIRNFTDINPFLFFQII